MAHKEQIDFCNSVKQKYSELFTNCKVLDIGSLDINGNNRYLFTNTDYTGIDIGKGNNVDIVCSGHLFKSANKFDIIISTECLEHDKYWKETLLNAYNLLNKDGLLLISCAAPGRDEHGTSTHASECSPFTNDYYKNISEEDFKQVFELDKCFSEYELKEAHETMHDLYFYGIKK
jgi:SAM-dependent methyltransferase